MTLAVSNEQVNIEKWIEHILETEIVSDLVITGQTGGFQLLVCQTLWNIQNLLPIQALASQHTKIELQCNFVKHHQFLFTFAHDSRIPYSKVVNSFSSHCHSATASQSKLTMDWQNVPIQCHCRLYVLEWNSCHLDQWRANARIVHQ